MKRKQLFSCFFIFVFFMPLANAKAKHGRRHRTDLDTISMTVSEEQWVKTNTAKLSVSINASLNNKNIASFREKLMSNLTVIAKGEWHMSEFRRSQDSSGLQKLYAKASVRLKQNMLTNVYEKAKTVSKAGLQFRVDNIDFTPSLKEMNSARMQLREKIYHKMTAEIKQLNQIYPNQSFSLHRVVFSENPSIDTMNNAAGPILLARSAKMAPSSETSYQLTLHALVVIAANRQNT